MSQISTIILESVTAEDKSNVETLLESASDKAMLRITAYVEGLKHDGLLLDLTFDDLQYLVETVDTDDELYTSDDL